MEVFTELLERVFGDPTTDYVRQILDPYGYFVIVALLFLSYCNVISAFSGMLLLLGYIGAIVVGLSAAEADFLHANRRDRPNAVPSQQLSGFDWFSVKKASDTHEGQTCNNVVHAPRCSRID
jgi:hypothetical protein